MLNVVSFIFNAKNGDTVNDETSYLGNSRLNPHEPLAAYTVLRELGLNDESIRIGFESYTSDNGRMQY
jgi:UDP-N-acetylmuramoylalanine-D-glutamate ligase